MLLAILNSIAIISIITGILFFVITYIAFAAEGVNEDVDRVYDELGQMISALLDADNSVLLRAVTRWAVFPPMLLAMLATITAYIITRRCE